MQAGGNVHIYETVMHSSPASYVPESSVNPSCSFKRFVTVPSKVAGHIAPFPIII